jgi:hypothetical protein
MIMYRNIQLHFCPAMQLCWAYMPLNLVIFLSANRNLPRIIPGRRIKSKWHKDMHEFRSHRGRDGTLPSNIFKNTPFYNSK